ncbi:MULTISPECIES: recombinase family protein [Bacillus]|uniref:recombinase family protein n=1 Tax=Bacillus TaxID=1386 RepID=UPI000BF98BC5|nr:MULTISPECIES: recombinase family protein [Bacillus]PFW05336.1 resolvase [Bacillus thuringiensis]QEQ20771.1 recombinase family protein [Bacillus sp. BS98]
MKIGYARVSKDEQNLDLQMDALKKAECERIFCEKVSGVSDKRIELKRALDVLREGDVLIVYKMDRLARSVKQLYEITDLLKEKKVQFISLQDNLDTTTPAGRAMFGMFAVFAEFERDIIRERTISGLKSARARGRIGGRPKKDSKKIQQAMELYNDKDKKFTVKEITEMTGVSPSTLYRELRARKED